MHKPFKKFGFFTSRKDNEPETNPKDPKLKSLYKQGDKVEKKKESAPKKSHKPKIEIREKTKDKNLAQQRVHKIEEEPRKKRHHKQKVDGPKTELNPKLNQEDIIFLSPRDIQQLRKKYDKADRKEEDEKKRHKSEKRKIPKDAALEMLKQHKINKNILAKLEDQNWLTKKEVLNLISDTKNVTGGTFNSSSLRQYFIFDKHVAFKPKHQSIVEDKKMAEAAKKIERKQGEKKESPKKIAAAEVKEKDSSVSNVKNYIFNILNKNLQDILKPSDDATKPPKQNMEMQYIQHVKKHRKRTDVENNPLILLSETLLDENCRNIDFLPATSKEVLYHNTRSVRRDYLVNSSDVSPCVSNEPIRKLKIFNERDVEVQVSELVSKKIKDEVLVTSATNRGRTKESDQIAVKPVKGRASKESLLKENKQKSKSKSKASEDRLPKESNKSLRKQSKMMAKQVKDNSSVKSVKKLAKSVVQTETQISREFPQSVPVNFFVQRSKIFNKNPLANPSNFSQNEPVKTGIKTSKVVTKSDREIINTSLAKDSEARKSKNSSIKTSRDISKDSLENRSIKSMNRKSKILDKIKCEKSRKSIKVISTKSSAKSLSKSRSKLSKINKKSNANLSDRISFKSVKHNSNTDTKSQRSIKSLYDRISIKTVKHQSKTAVKRKSSESIRNVTPQVSKHTIRKRSHHSNLNNSDQTSERSRESLKTTSINGGSTSPEQIKTEVSRDPECSKVILKDKSEHVLKLNKKLSVNLIPSKHLVQSFLPVIEILPMSMSEGANIPAKKLGRPRKWLRNNRKESQSKIPVYQYSASPGSSIRFAQNSPKISEIRRSSILKAPSKPVPKQFIINNTLINDNGDISAPSTPKTESSNKPQTSLNEPPKIRCRTFDRLHLNTASNTASMISDFCDHSVTGDSPRKATTLMLTKTYREQDQLNRLQKQKMYSEQIRQKALKGRQSKDVKVIPPQVLEVRYLTVSQDQPSVEDERHNFVMTPESDPKPKKKSFFGKSCFKETPRKYRRRFKTKSDSPKSTPKDGNDEGGNVSPPIQLVSREQFNELFSMPDEINEILNENLNFLRKDFNNYQIPSCFQSCDNLNKDCDDWCDFYVESAQDIAFDENAAIDEVYRNELFEQRPLPDLKKSGLAGSCSARASEESGYATVNSSNDTTAASQFFRRPEIKALLEPGLETQDANFLYMYRERKDGGKLVDGSNNKNGARSYPSTFDSSSEPSMKSRLSLEEMPELMRFSSDSENSVWSNNKKNFHVMKSHRDNRSVKDYGPFGVDSEAFDFASLEGCKSEENNEVMRKDDVKSNRAGGKQESAPWYWFLKSFFNIKNWKLPVTTLSCVKTSSDDTDN